MSQTNNPGEEDDQRDSVAEDFEFYFPFAKTLALDLPTPEDTSIAAAWVQKLEAEPESEEEKRTRLNYLKLLLFVLQRGRLSGMFRKQPPSGALQPFPQGLSILDMGNLMLDQDDTPTCGEGDARCLPYTTEISNDLREFVAAQEIPNFGVQMYYAWSSDEPVHKWLSFDEEKFPQFVLDKIKQLKEVKSDEKSTIVKNGCLIPKTGCDLLLLEKTSKKRVKSPQEIEKSQGRSFHTYVGLVGRMGNFSDKCGDDPDKCQRQDPGKGKCPRRNLQRQYTGSRGEAEEMPTEDELANFLSGVGGLNALNRPCLCPILGGYPHYPEHCGKGGPQHFQEQQTPPMNYTFPLGDRKQPENCQWNTGESRITTQRHFNEEQCPTNVIPPPVQSQRRTPSPRSKSYSSNRPNVDCPPQDDGRFSNRDAVCCCSSPPCTCPCPRAVSQVPMKKTPSSTKAAAGGRGTVDPSLTCAKQGASSYRKSREDPCVAVSQGPDPGPSGTGKSGVGSRPNSRTKSPQIIHCFDDQNPDPCLTQTVSRLESLTWSEEGDIDTPESDAINDCFVSEKSPQPTFQKANTPPQREVYDACQQRPKVHTSTCPAMSGVQQKSDRYSPPSVGQKSRSPPCTKSPRTPSPQAPPRPVCQVPQEPPQEPPQQCRPNQQFSQNYQARPVQVRPGPNKVCAGPPTDPCSATPQPVDQPENLYAFLDKFPPDCPGFTPPSFENVFLRPPADMYIPSSPHWNHPEYQYDFLDKFAPNAPGYKAPAANDECGAPAPGPCQTQPQVGNQPEDLYAFLEKHFPPNAPRSSPSGLTGKPPRMRPGADLCQPQAQYGNQPEDLYAFLEKNFPPRAPGPAASGLSSKPGQMLAGLSDVCGRPAADSCRPPPSQPGNQLEDMCAFLENFPANAPGSSPSGLTGRPPRMRPGADSCQPQTQIGNQPEDLYAFLEKNFPPRAPGPSAPSIKSTRMANVASLLQGINQRREAHREKCDQSGPRKPPGNDAGFCQPSGQPPANVCPEQALPPGAVFPNYCGESRSPRAPVCPDTRTCMRHPMANRKSAHMEGCPGNPPNRPCTNLPVSFQCKTAASMTQQPHSLRQPQVGGNAGQEACEADEEGEDECESSESAGEVCPKETVPMYVLPCAPQRSPGRAPQQAQGPSREATGQICGSQSMMPGRSLQPQPSANAWSGVQSGASSRPSGKTPQQEQCTYKMGEVQSIAPKRISPGKTYGQEAIIYREPNVQTGSRRRASPKKAVEEKYNEEWKEMPASTFQTHQQGYGNELYPNKEPNVQTFSRKKSPGKVVQEECNEEWTEMPASTFQTHQQGYGNELYPNKEPNVQTFSRKKSPGKVVQEECNVEWTEMPVSAFQTHQQGKVSVQESNAIECPGVQSSAAQMPQAGTSFRKESRKSKEPDIQCFPPQNLGPGKAAKQDQNAEEWSELASGFSEKTSSRGSRIKDDETPVWLPLMWGRKSSEAEGPGPKEANIQSYGPSQRKSIGKPGSQEPAPNCAQPANPTQRIYPRTRLPQNKLSHQKSSSRTYQSLTDTRSKSVRKSKPSSSKTEMRSDNYISTKSKIEAKTKPKIKSETQMKIKPETQLKIKPETQMKIKSEPNMKFKSNSKVKIKCVSKDLTFETKRKTHQQISFKEQKGAHTCCTQGQQNVGQDCAEQVIPSYRGNPYMESSLTYQKTRFPLAKSSTPKKLLDSFSQNVSTLTTVNQYDGQCAYNSMEFCDDQDESVEYMPLYSQNVDVSAGKFFNLPEVTGQCPQESFDSNCTPVDTKYASQEVAFQTCQDEATIVDSDNPDNGCFRVYYSE